MRVIIFTPLLPGMVPHLDGYVCTLAAFRWFYGGVNFISLVVIRRVIRGEDQERGSGRKVSV